jgi:hypothetical protein
MTCPVGPRSVWPQQQTPQTLTLFVLCSYRGPRSTPPRVLRAPPPRGVPRMHAEPTSPEQLCRPRGSVSEAGCCRCRWFLPNPSRHESRARLIRSPSKSRCWSTRCRRWSPMYSQERAENTGCFRRRGYLRHPTRRIRRCSPCCSGQRTRDLRRRPGPKSSAHGRRCRPVAQGHTNCRVLVGVGGVHPVREREIPARRTLDLEIRGRSYPREIGLPALAGVGLEVPAAALRGSARASQGQSQAMRRADSDVAAHGRVRRRRRAASPAAKEPAVTRRTLTTRRSYLFGFAASFLFTAAATLARPEISSTLGSSTISIRRFSLRPGSVLLPRIGSYSL